MKKGTITSTRTKSRKSSFLVQGELLKNESSVSPPHTVLLAVYEVKLRNLQENFSIWTIETLLIVLLLIFPGSQPLFFACSRPLQHKFSRPSKLLKLFLKIVVCTLLKRKWR